MPPLFAARPRAYPDGDSDDGGSAVKERPILRRTILAGLVVATALFVLWEISRLATRAALQEGQARALSSLRLTVAALAGHLERYEVVPALLADHERMRRLFDDPPGPDRIAGANAWLAARNLAIGSAEIYVMDRQGDTLAASNHAEPDSFVGHNFRYRPYFAEALAGAPGRFYGRGTTSGIRGYYFSTPVFDAREEVAGVVAVKIELDGIEAAWRESGQRILVTDPEGIVFMSSDPAWLYRAFLPLTPERLARTATSRRYADSPLAPLGQMEAEEAGVRLLRLPRPDGGVGREFVTIALPMEEAGWTVHVLLDAEPLRSSAGLVVASAALLICAAGFALVLIRERRRRIRERLALQAQAREELEHRVEERTADLARVNRALASEVAERKVTEGELRRTQARLVQAGKLAALGQMSAALSLEINQPRAAARNYADSAAILMDRGELPHARENVTQILALIDRIAAIGQHLRNVARKPNEKLVAVALPAVVADTLMIAAPRLTAAGAEVAVDLPPDLPPVRAGAVRLQQVLVNLVTNAADAVEGRADRRIDLSARAEGGQVAIRIRDRGPGVAPAIAERIFDPFFTTKGIGAGLGLGLSITYNIVRDFGGEIGVETLPAAEGGGACFTLRLNAALPEERAA